MTELEPVPMSKSATTMSRLMQPDEANVYGNIHGGSILKYIDEAAGVAAWRHARCPKVVTASFDRMSFDEPVYIGDILHVHATVRVTGRTSMTCGVRVEAEDPATGGVRLCCRAHVTFVALDKRNKPIPVPAVYAENEVEQEKMDRAKLVHQTIKDLSRKRHK